MSEFTSHQLLLMRIRDEKCGGNAAELARRIKRSPTYISRLFYPTGKAGAKGIGLEIMSACTEEFELHPGYWDGVVATASSIAPSGGFGMPAAIASGSANRQFTRVQASAAGSGVCNVQHFRQ